MVMDHGRVVDLRRHTPRSPTPMRHKAGTFIDSECRVLSGLLTIIRLVLASRAALLAENLFLRKQLALYRERQVKSRRTTSRVRLALIALSHFFDWRALIIVKPETFVRWNGIPQLVAVEVTQALPPAAAEEHPGSHPRDGRR
jgi:hypothetical protein